MSKDFPIPAGINVSKKKFVTMIIIYAIWLSYLITLGVLRQIG